MELTAYLHACYIPSRMKISTDTVEQMEIAISQLEKQLGRTVTPDELNAKVILCHLRWLRDQGKSAGTQRSRRSYLIALWRDAFRNNQNTHNPLAEKVPSVPEPKRQPRAWSVSDLQKMLDQATLIDTKGRHNFGPLCWRALILLIYYTGLRISAVLKLKLSDLQGNILYVPAHIQKDNEEMVIPLPEELVLLMNRINRPRKFSEQLLPWPWRLKGAAAKLTRYILKPAGLPMSPKLKFHGIRRTTATIAAAKIGKEAARDMLGHSSVKVTERYIADAALIDPSLPGRIHPMHVLPKLK